jgi:hypothetical protein
MKKQQRNSQKKALRTGKVCPRCKTGKLVRDGRTPGGKQRWSCKTQAGGKSELCYTTTAPDLPYVNTQSGIPAEGDKNPQFRRALGGIKRFVITSAQNATPLHEPFFMALKQYCAHNDAELVVIPIRYKNPTSRFTESQAGAEVWDPALAPYLYNQRKKLNENLILLGDIKVQPTATKPLSAFEAITAGESGILGHTKLQFKTVAAPQGRFPKILTTTGACTVKNYTDSKAGKKGEFHHTIGACAVDIDGKKFHMRQINATRDGSFIDYTTEYTPHGVYEADPALALIFGDTHRKFIDKKVEAATFGPNGMVDQFNPEHLVFHDLHDGYARNPHHRLNPFNEIAKRQTDMHIVEKEVMEDIEWLKKVVGNRKGTIVASNHDDFFARWIMDTDWRRDPDNAEFYLETAKQMVQSVKMTESGMSVVDPFVYWVNKLKGQAPITCLGRGDSFNLAGIELSLHGDKGPNGSRGSRENLRRIGVKTVVGHSHSPGIEEGCYQAGTSTPLQLEYNTGPSSWLQCHVVLYANGKRSLLPIIDGEWCVE